VTIKSHHKVGCLPERMNLRLARNPYANCFKDEVRSLGRDSAAGAFGGRPSRSPVRALAIR